jgi:hypothetical protein
MESGEHPMFRMWRDRLHAELAQEQSRAVRQAEREAERKEWYAAWHTYKEHRATDPRRMVRPRWWNFLAWLLYLMRLRSPGGPN